MKRAVSSLLLFTVLSGYSQDIPLNGDCFSAAQIDAKGVYRFDRAPKGYGTKLEISGNPMNSPHYFQREDNTAWFYFDALSDDMMVFKIYPSDTAADFDFLLFKSSDEKFCSDVILKKVRPVRTNISRYDPEVLSATGLSPGAQDEFVSAGPGNHFSKAMEVKKGERYYLVINNVYGTETGFSLSFEYYKTTTLSGLVKDEESGKPIGNATVSWEEKSGEILAEGMSDPVTGEYDFSVPVRKGSRLGEYVLSVSEPAHFFTDQLVKASLDEPPKILVTVLPELKKGKKMILKNINFFGDSDKALASCRPTFKRLEKLMKANNSLVIRIEGHTNGCSRGVDYSQHLSEARARAVMTYLTDHRIEAARVSTIGLNCSQMLFPKAKSEEEQSLNRRVEFVVLDY